MNRDQTITPPANDRRSASRKLVIEPRNGWRAVDFGELTSRRDLLFYMTLRGIKARYAQSALGIGWAVAQPLITMIVYTIIFSRVAKIPVPSDLPYALIAFCGIVPWSFFSGALSQASASLVGNAAMISKIYFPRMILPLSQVLSRLIDLAITLTILLVLIVSYGYVPRIDASAVVLVPLMTLIAAMAALGAGLWLSAMAVQYRDVGYALPFVVQIGMYLSPVIYLSTMIPGPLRPIFGLNPMVGVIATYRATLLGMHPIPWMLMLESIAVTAVLLGSGVLYFRRAERLFADVV